MSLPIGFPNPKYRSLHPTGIASFILCIVTIESSLLNMLKVNLCISPILRITGILGLYVNFKLNTLYRSVTFKEMLY